MRAMMNNACMNSAANVADGFSCAAIIILMDAILASIFSILGILSLCGILLVLSCLLLVLRRFIHSPQSTHLA